ncbi:hypothetical protein Acor_23080 [Acrocarpospora corrugata]|uniref:Uncharacterized protein n=1 Tax=Acrocarpospora corrugata TaxID=35763 RepID=A0A5M3VTW2_9ACTN|nr:hypothetical protein [Acrocarpospora corrugata]GES00245.1 hypothetical protein Acor_23080 [Acrocarpospora corrugata]
MHDSNNDTGRGKGRQEGGDRLDRVLHWVLFILPAVSGCLFWMLSGRNPQDYPQEMAYLAWTAAVVGVLLILRDHYSKSPGDR